MIYFVLPLLFLLFSSASGAVIPDPEFDDYDCWLNPNRSIIMRKYLPPEANTTWGRYYRSWGMDYEEEMAKKELTMAAAELIDRHLIGYTGKSNFTVKLQIYIVKCSEGKNGWDDEQYEEDFVKGKPTFDWSAEYCQSKIVDKWCDKGDRLKINLAANSTTSIGTEFLANVTFTCPISFYYLFLNTFRTVTKDSYEFKKAFWIALGVSATCLLLLSALGIYCLCERRNRKLSQMANYEHWRRFRSKLTYHSFDIPEYDIPSMSEGVEDTVVVDMEAPPTRK
uniref:Uncharacterized protein n=1 Tax=Caenorhabditis tropicalis TaxID=1561998 RepID=A0A1I7U3W7_9PELO